ncbi:hypothetical protein CcaverHIS002_0606620 [Cutaneotrichosporon cavernicola]|uniref:Uncharacterized protein n=1 Tax=Cutaneotrichosporon cavernicola TaxID=279322 RepID=A0AA48L914_9TREE|nr:uncharacterized protein CcaverHIS019_0606060 [Cutaneotrichosporon cavernicola]BEI86375.1 hypothetical protein CcaverHIS002_0606620 [Cutaneotrichosporon cavernicola]BEI94147.1 hypothetical protein CcaverHIS019_0606060 [Cutaneotrichosporon cavernicola]BEJ01927.1 hypothetical protein CcaverHIS631_0606090 [Cutaneotrichosporon cavernicola]BEJ09691.1 hypothetical protein CcaverHIS641_0606060 [Cutaneotrichosporon cavernicola]
MSGNQGDQNQQFTIQPHPATTNDPRDLVGEVQGGANAFNTPGIQQIPDKVAAALEKPKTRDELEARTKELNK